MIVPFRQVVAEYIAGPLALAAEKTRRHQTTVLTLALRELATARPSAAEVTAWLQARIEAGKIVGSTANSYQQIIARAYADAVTRRPAVNPMATLRKFPTAQAVPRALPADAPGGRAAIVERLQAVACRHPLEVALVAVLYDAGLRIEEALGLRLGTDLDLAAGVVWVRGQRDPAGLTHVPRTKTHGSNARLNLAPETVTVLRRALADPKRGDFGERAGGGRWKGWRERAALAAEFVFPFRARQLATLLGRMRAVVPGAFPKGDAWHVFRHSMASDMDDVRDASGRRAYDPAEIGNRLRHNPMSGHTLKYLARLRGRECATDLDALRAHREAQRVEARKGTVVVGIARCETKNEEVVAVVGGGDVESVGCRVQSAGGSWSGSTHDTGHRDTHHKPTSSAPSAARGSLPLAFPPHPVVPRPPRASKAKRGGR